MKTHREIMGKFAIAARENIEAIGNFYKTMNSLSDTLHKQYPKGLWTKNTSNK